MANHLFEKVTTGLVKIVIDQRYKLDNIIEAHNALEQRITTGATVLEI